MRLFKKLRRKIDYLDDSKIDRIHQAYLFAFDAHKEQKRSTGEPYITHPVAVAVILSEMKMDYQTIMAGLLHDVIEDTDVTKYHLVVKFGQQIADLVDGVSKLTQMKFGSHAEEQGENFRKMLFAMAKDIRVILIKLADRLHNMRTLGSLQPRRQLRKAKETLEIFAPIAKRLGMRDLSVELEELGFSKRYPNRYTILKNAIYRARGNRKKVLNTIEKTLQEGLSGGCLISYSLKGREKHLYSIYRKMKNKLISFSEVMDVYAFRIVVSDVDSCYRALGMVHNLYKPVPERFKDYIAIPKANGYQSLHTTLFGPYSLSIEVQIRTTEMDRIATNGIAAHWLYKLDNHAMTTSKNRANRWVKNLLELQQNIRNPLEFIESVKVNLFPDEVYVFTPKGRILELPKGATAVDFAYSVHTDIGNSCVAAKVDRKLRSLADPLTNGQTVEVITADNAYPNLAWLDFVVTSKARSSIRSFFKNQKHKEAVFLGKKLLQKALSSFNLSWRKVSKSAVGQFLKEIQLNSPDDLFFEIGVGNRIALLIAQRLSNLYSGYVEKPPSIEKTADSRVTIKGTEGMLVNYADCCGPVLNDPIVGVLQKETGILVHVDGCKQVRKLHNTPGQLIPLCWAEQVKENFLASVEIEVINRQGILAIMALAISDTDGSVDDMDVVDRKGDRYRVLFTIVVRDRVHLARIIKNLRKITAIIKIGRNII